MKYFVWVVFVSLVTTTVFSQQNDPFPVEPITNPLHRSNIGKVTFMNGNIPLSEYTASQFLQRYTMGRRSDLNIRVFMNNSVSSYMYRVAPAMPTEQLLRSGNLQFSFFVDEQMIYKENIHYRCNFGSSVNKNTATTFRVPLTNSTGQDWWSMYMWDRFKLNGGQRALTEGVHKFRLELRPYVMMDSLGRDTRVGELIAAGEITLVIVMPKITASQVAVQKILPGSGWQISNFPFNRKKIEELNREIAKDNIRDITSLVVIHDGKLLIEEYFNDAKRSTLHDTRSAGKSFASTLMGFAIQDGHIKNENEPLSKFYNLAKYANYASVKDSITISELLTMSSVFNGSDADNDSPGNEENMYPTDNWVKFALDLPIDSSKVVSKRWDYFTAGVILIGDILDKSVPGGLEKYAEKRLFKPLGISKYQWQYTPQKVVNTAGSLQMRSIDYAKYAQLYRNGGVWNNRQLLNKDWVAKTFTRHLAIPGRDNEFYGYLFWNKQFTYNGKSYDAYYCAGNGGNHFVIFKELPLVIIITGKAYNKSYAHPQVKRVIEEFVIPSLE